MPNFCLECGNKLEGNPSFCPECGFKLVKENINEDHKFDEFDDVYNKIWSRYEKEKSTKFNPNLIGKALLRNQPLSINNSMYCSHCGSHVPVKFEETGLIFKNKHLVCSNCGSKSLFKENVELIDKKKLRL